MKKPNYSSNKSYSHVNRDGDTNRRETYNRRIYRRGKKHFAIPTVLISIILIGLVVVINLRKKSDYQSYTTNNTVNTSSNITSDISFDSSQSSASTCIADPGSIPDYSGKDYIIINDGKPNFTDNDYKSISGQKFSNLDSLGRCGTAVAMIDRSMMPTGKRGDIGEVKPTGWVQNKYAGVIDSQPPYLYNRCHLIAYALTGENANEKNLITGTRYMNATVMLPWEEKVMKYLDYSDNHVLYRVTPYFKGSELLARGVEMEAYSVEDNGAGVCYHVFIYNVQPGIMINYNTGDNRLED